MKRNLTKIWLLFVACSVTMLGIFGWIALRTVELERQRDENQTMLEEGRLALTVEERVNSAFWRIDSMMSIFIGQEASRDPLDYLPFRETSSYVFPPSTNRGNNSTTDVLGNDGKPDANLSSMLNPSPLLESPSDFVRLHVQYSPDGTVSSPQAPSGDFCRTALSYGVDDESIMSSCKLLSEAEELSDYKVVSFMCPSTPAKTPAEDERPWIFEQNRPGPLGKGNLAEITQPLWAQPLQSESGKTPEANSLNQTISDYVGMANSRECVENDNRSKFSQNAVYNVGNKNPQTLGDDAPDARRVGSMRPVWIKDQLLLVRRVDFPNQQQVVQCCWLDWGKLKAFLQAEIADLIPNADFRPVTETSVVNPGRTSSTLPIELLLPEGGGSFSLSPQSNQTSGGLMPALWSAGLASMVAIGALALLLAGVIRLSERRATFVSAVSHELRTPLTTFRIYSEMLADGMVTDPKQREEYIQTLKTESERLGHLVDNVLVYAGLENRAGQTSRQTVNIDELLKRVVPVLERIVESSGAMLELAVDDAVRNKLVHTDVQAIERVLVNLVDNAIKYGGSGLTCDIGFSATVLDHSLVLEISDQGPGIPPDRLQKLFRPFSRSDSESAGAAPGVGLGLALCKRIATDLGGKLLYQPANPGSRFQLWLPVREGA